MFTWESFYLSFSTQQCCLSALKTMLKTLNSWLTFLFQHFEYNIPFSFSLKSLLRNLPIIVLYVTSPSSCCFQNSLSLGFGNLITTCLGIVLFGFKLFLVSWIWMSVFLLRFEKLSTIIVWSILLTVPFSSPPRIIIMRVLFLLMESHGLPFLISPLDG